MLGGQGGRHVGRQRRRIHRERVTVVADDGGALVLGEGELAGCQDLVDGVTEHGQPELPVAERPVDVEPVRVRRVLPVQQDVPELLVQVLRLGDAMWLGTTSTTMPRPCSWAAAANASSPSRPPRSSETRLWSTTS